MSTCDRGSVARSALKSAPVQRAVHRLDLLPYSSLCVAVNRQPFCVRTVSHTPRNAGSTPRFTGTRACTSLLWEVVDRECVGGISCASARAAAVNFQACSIDHSDISPFRINKLRAVENSVAQTSPDAYSIRHLAQCQPLSGAHAR